MKTKIISQQKNPFLEREEYILEIKNESMPSKESIIDDLGKDKELTLVRKINRSFGTKIFTADVTVYNNIEAKEKNTIIPKRIKKKMLEEKKKKEQEEKKKKLEEQKVKEETLKKEQEKPKEETKEEQKK